MEKTVKFSLFAKKMDMKKRLLFVTNNKHKLEEIRHLVGGRFEIISLKDAGITEDIPETGTTLESNASLKSWYAYNKTGLNCFADDTGLEVDALNGQPGVYSARYAGPEHDHRKNIEKLLKELGDEVNRKARFRTVISLIINNKEYLFEGLVEGVILDDLHGEGGFGYDPVFRPDGFDLTFAGMNMEEKNRISHRGRATAKLIGFLENMKETQWL